MRGLKMDAKLLAILLLSGLSAAHPQYSPPALGEDLDQLQQVGGIPQVLPQASDGTSLTQEQQDALKELWSKVEGAFGGGGSEGKAEGGGDTQQVKGDDTGDELSADCGDPGYDCVPYFQCIDGVINTEGIGLIDVRIKPQATCVNPEYAEVPALCCRIPDHKVPEVPVVPEKGCTGHEECVDYIQCSEDGYIVTDGSGIIDVRLAHTACYLESGKTGRCCKPPPIVDEKPRYVDLCPDLSTCVPHGECFGQALDYSDKFVQYVKELKWTECPLKFGSNGICCIPPTPKLLDHCPTNSVCTYPSECLGTALDGSQNFVPYLPTGTWSECALKDKEVPGVCCIPPPHKLIDLCPSNAICIQEGRCLGKALDGAGSFVPYSAELPSWSHCKLGDSPDPGLCCINPAAPVLEASSQCGIRNYHVDQRIQSNYAHNEAAFGEFPWQAIVFFKNYTFRCGASLISHKHVLTAAHCVHASLPKDFQIRLGEWQVNSFEEELPYEDHNVHTIYVHPEFNPKNVHNDIAVLELAEPVKLQYHINTICLPEHAVVLHNGDPCVATGWGKDSFEGKFQHILKKIELPSVEYEICQKLLKETRLGKHFKLDKSFICAGGEENKDACYGDGGGPLVCKNPATGQYVLAGITAWGIGCGNKNVPGVYANVQYLSKWVNEIVSGFQQHQQQDIKEDIGPVGYGK